MTQIDDGPAAGQPDAPRAVLPLVYGSSETSSEWRIVLRVLAVAGCVMALGRLVLGVAGLLFVIGFAPSLRPMSTVPQVPRLSGWIGGVTLGCGSIMVLTGKERRGAALIIIGEWICLALSASYAIFMIVAASMNQPTWGSSPGYAVIIYSYVSSVGYALTLMAYSALYILLLRAYRRASGTFTQ
jgi:hypothetical protein